MAEIRLDQEKKPPAGKHGGARAGAGRPPGSRTTMLNATRALSAKVIQAADPGHARRTVREAIAGTRLDPLMVLVKIATTSKDERLQVEAAAVATKYIYPSLSAATVQTEHRTVDAATAMASLHAQLDRLAAPTTIDASPEAVSVPQADEPAPAPEPPPEPPDATEPEPGRPAIRLVR